METDIKATKAHRFPEEAFDASWLFLTAAGLFQNELCDRRARFKGEFAGENDMSFGAETIDRVVERYPLRGFDAIHLASAMVIHERLPEDFVFACFDDSLVSAARSEQLETLSP